METPNEVEKLTARIEQIEELQRDTLDLMRGQREALEALGMATLAQHRAVAILAVPKQAAVAQGGPAGPLAVN